MTWQEVMEHTRQLRAQGFHKLKPGHIHMRCPRCGRKQSNERRHTEHDPPHATLIEILCDDCGAGCKDDAPSYFTASGREIDYWRWYESQERAVRPGKKRRRTT